MSRALVLTVAVLLAGATIFLALHGGGETPRQAPPDAPNFIVVMTDDQALNTWNRDVMPRTFERIVDQGTDFRESFALPPLCCPDRASFLTGRYPHNHGVVTNNYNALEDPEDVLPVWLDEAGYETMLAGKFLNRYENAKGTNNGLEPAPGWDEWWSISGDSRKYFDYTASVDGEPVPYGSRRKDYVTNAITDAAVDFIGERTSDDSPFFLWMTQFAPHFGPRDTGGKCPPGSSPIALLSDFKAARGVHLPKPPNFLEPNVNDKPPFVARLPEGPKSNEKLRGRYRCSVAALAAVDRSVEKIFKTLEVTGQADDTVVFFTSDNGEFLGEHRKTEGKKLPYDAALRVPLAVTAPENVLGEPPVPTANEAVGTIDLAPTMLEMAGLEGDHRLDGRSLLGTMSRSAEPLPPDRGLAVELGRDEGGGRCSGYTAFRDRDFLYTQYRHPTPDDACGVGARELYDVRKDPFQLRNLLGTSRVDPADEAQADALSERLELLSTCSGIEGRDPPGDTPFCE